MRSRLIWLLAVPIMVIGWFAAHALSYRITIPDPVARARFFQDTGHTDLGYQSLLLALAAAFLVVALTVRVRRVAAARAGKAAVAAWPFALLPPLAFVFEEYADRLLHDGSFELSTALERTFVIGLLTQVPFGLLALLLARMILHLADRLGEALACNPSIAPPRGRAVWRMPATVDVPRLRPIASGQVDRGPPLRTVFDV